MSDEAFRRKINKNDILFLCETWLRRENITNLKHPNGYLCNFIFRNKRRKKGLPFGGVLVYFRNELNKVVSVFNKANENILWIRAGKEFLE